MPLQCRKSKNAALRLLLTLSYLSPASVVSECILGPNNVAQLTSRNAAILSVMNETLFNHTSAAESVISKGSDFSLTAYLSQNHTLDSESYFTFASRGKMLKINWTLATKSAAVNNTFDGLKLDAYISERFVQPVHAALNNLAEMFSFSTGIFRPRQPQFHYTGYSTDSTGNSILDTTCYAGSAFVWRFCTDIPFNIEFLNHSSSEFGNLATIMERALDHYYRTKTILGDDFVRANMKSVTRRLDGTPYTVVYVEVYFRNASYNNSIVTSLTLLNQLNITYQEEGSTLAKPVVLCAPTSTRINSTLYDSFASSTVTSTYLSILPRISTYSGNSAVYTERTTTGISAASPSDLTTRTIVTGLVTTASSDLTTSNAVNMSTKSLSSTFTSFGVNSTMIAAMLTTQQFISNSHSVTTTPTSANSSNVTQITSLNISTNTSTTSNLLYNASSYSSANATVINNGSVTPSTAKGVTALNIANMTAIINGTLRASTSDRLVTPTASPGSNNSNGGTTYDPDPFFKASVPVVTKVYNDDYLLRMKIGTMKPLTETKNFLVVTIPALVGMLALLVCCLFCWQKDCFPQDQKTRAF